METIIFSIRGLFRKKFRTFLTITSISIGICAVLMISVISDAGKRAINKELDSLGINGISLSVPTATKDTSLENEDLEFVRSLPYVDTATPVVMSTGYLKTDDQSSSSILWGIDSGAEQVISLDVKKGKGITKADVAGSENVCMIDSATAERLFNKNSIILGKEIDVFISGNTSSFKIVGIVEADSGLLSSVVGNFIPTIIYLPYTTLQNELGSSRISQIAVRVNAKNNNDVDNISQQVESAINREKATGSIIKAENLAKQRGKLSGTLDIITIVLSLIGAISLLVAGLGTMTVMMVSVSERTREIGIKKSIGAKRRAIIKEFIFESSALSLFGCLLGIALTTIIMLIASAVMHYTFILTAVQVVTAIVVSMICGVVFGIYPAYTAAKLNPVDALRCE